MFKKFIHFLRKTIIKIVSFDTNLTKYFTSLINNTNEKIQGIKTFNQMVSRKFDKRL